MKTFLWENKGKLILLLILTLCMVGLRTVNIHQVWYYLTPWKNLGRPPVEAQKIAQVNLPVEGDVPQAAVYIKAAPREFYGCCNLTEAGGWAPADKPFYKFYGSVDAKTVACTERIKFEWGIPSSIQNAKDTGRCYPHEYAVYQLKQDGSVWGKTVREEGPRQLKSIAFEVIFFILLLYLVFLAIILLGKQQRVKENNNQIKTNQAPTTSIWLSLIGLIIIAISVLAFRYYTDINETIKREFTGEYIRRGDWVFKINLRANQTFHMEIFSDFGDPIPYEDEGSFTIRDGKIILAGSPENSYANKFGFIPIKWGERKYLFEDALIFSFCDPIELRINSSGTYIHQDDWKLPAEGEPRFMDGRKACP
jgi:hypothetical protein